jgi:amino acid transporter
MKLKCFFGLFVRIVISVIFAGIFYAGWMAVAIPVLKSGPLFAKTFCWLLAPVMTGAGFAAGVAIFELLPGTRKSDLRDIVLWPLAGCAIGAVVVFFFGPMLIVFAMFGFGTAAVLTKEIVSMKKRKIEVESTSSKKVC